MKRLYYVDAIVNTPVKITVMAESREQAEARLNLGTWHSCEASPRTWDEAKLQSYSTIKEGPKVN